MLTTVNTQAVSSPMRDASLGALIDAANALLDGGVSRDAIVSGMPADLVVVSSQIVNGSERVATSAVVAPEDVN